MSAKKLEIKSVSGCNGTGSREQAEDFRWKFPGGRSQGGANRELCPGKETGEPRELRGLPVVEDRNTWSRIHCLRGVI